MDERDLREAVVASLVEIAPEAELQALDPQRSFHDQLDIDSVDFLNLMMSLEKRFGIDIPAGDFPRLSSLAGAVAYLAAAAADRERAADGSR
jgi:acyl carrier protein